MTVSIGITMNEGLLTVSIYRCDTGNLDVELTKEENEAANLTEVAVYNAIKEGVGRRMLPPTTVKWNGERLRITR